MDKERATPRGVIVRRVESTEAIDLDTWCRAYIRHICALEGYTVTFKEAA